MARYTAACLQRLSPRCALFAAAAAAAAQPEGGNEQKPGPARGGSASGAGQPLVAALARAGGGIELVRVPSWAPLFESLPITAEPMVLLADADARDAAAAHAEDRKSVV